MIFVFLFLTYFTLYDRQEKNLKKNRYVYMYNWITLLYTWNYHNTVNQLYSNIKLKVFKKSTKNKCWRGYGEKGTLLHCLREYNLVQPLQRTVWNVFKKLKIELQYDTAIPLLGIYSEFMHPYVHSSTIYNSQDMETT